MLRLQKLAVSLLLSSTFFDTLILCSLTTSPKAVLHFFIQRTSFRSKSFCHCGADTCRHPPHPTPTFFLHVALNGGNLGRFWLLFFLVLQSEFGCLVYLPCIYVRKFCKERGTLKKSHPVAPHSKQTLSPFLRPCELAHCFRNSTEAVTQTRHPSESQTNSPVALLA